jgi:hypothetical protein
MATAAAIAAAAATAVSVGAGVASQAGAFGGGGPGKPEFKPVPKRPFETAQQKYMSRVMMANLNTRGPTWDEWLSSGGKARFELQGTGMTPFEAERLGFVGPGGRAPQMVEPTTVSETGLTPAQFIYGGMERGPEAKGPAARAGRIQKRITRLEAIGQEPGGLKPGQQRRLERLRTRQGRIVGRTMGPGE